MIYVVISRDGELAGLYTSPVDAHVDAHERSRGVDGKVVLALLNENSPCARDCDATAAPGPLSQTVPWALKPDAKHLMVDCKQQLVREPASNGE